MSHRRGIALVSVLIVLVAFLAIISAGLQLGNSGILHVSQTHRRNVALCAAEAGVYEAMVRLEADKAFSGSAQGTLQQSGGSFTIEVENHLWTGGPATVLSTGTFGGVSRTLKVELEPDTEGFGGLSLGGKLYTYDQAYINGIASAFNPLYRPGNAHSSYGEDAFVGGDFNMDGKAAVLKATGDLSTAGHFDSNLDVVARNKEEGSSKPQYRLDKASMLAGTFSGSSVPSDGRVTGNTRLNDDVVFLQKVHIEKGATLHVRGDAKFLAGVDGEGSLVVDGDVVIQTDAKFDPEINEGLKVLADGSIAVSHPNASTDDDGIHYEIDAVGDYFAQMPSEAPSQISQSIPVSAPRDGDFFLWVDSKLGSGSGSGGGDPEFDLWYNGDGSELNPGLNDTTKEWLEKSRNIKDQIKAWADSN